MLGRHDVWKLAAAAFVAWGAAGCSEHGVAIPPQTTRSELSFQLGISPSEDKVFRDKLLAFASQDIGAGRRISLSPRRTPSRSYALLTAMDCRHATGILRSTIKAAAPAERVDQYLAAAAATAECVDGVPLATARCEITNDFAGRLLVPDERAARDVFAAVERGVKPDADRSLYPDILVIDYGDEWSVVRGRIPRRVLFWREGPNYGGGQLGMNINKCDGAVSGLHLTE